MTHRRPSRPRPFPAGPALALALALGLGAGAGPAEGRAAGAERPRSEAAAKSELDRVRARIRQVTERVQDDVAKRDKVAAELRDADRAIGTARERLDSVRERRLESEKRRAALAAEQRRTETALAAERGALAAELRAAYVSGREEQLRVLLNAEDPATLGRMLGYYGYLGRARAERIGVIREQVARLETLEQELAAADLKLAELEDERRTEVAALDRARASREQSLGELKRRIATRSGELADLKANAAALESLIEKLRAALRERETPAFEAPGGPRGAFAQVRGRLPWPAQGRVVAGFGEPRPGGLRWNGLLLETRPGGAVRAPYFGRVVYSDWLPGLGLLLILDHGGGYLTLYGHNEKVYKTVGERVSPGDVLASSGEAGAGGRPELYFEIRQGSRPVNPRPWLKGSPGR